MNSDSRFFDLAEQCRHSSLNITNPLSQKWTPNPDRPFCRVMIGGSSNSIGRPCISTGRSQFEDREPLSCLDRRVFEIDQRRVLFPVCGDDKRGASLSAFGRLFSRRFFDAEFKGDPGFRKDLQNFFVLRW